MNEAQIKGNWNQIKGKVKEKWGQLTNDDLDQIDGKADQLVGAIQRRYGRSLEQAKNDVREWRRITNC
jgi:uncharacterized protein YjbJ (UPF0337 family)